jgi:hypothetical protein
VTRMLVARLGGLPKNKEAVRAFGEWVLTLERASRTCPLLPGLGRKALEDLIWSLLERAHGREGLQSFQVSGTRSGERDPENASVLAVVGVHATRSVFALHYERFPAIGQNGKPPDRTRWVREKLHLYPIAKRELEALRQRLSRRYPGLEAALRGLKDPPLLVEAVPRGQVVFLLNPAEEATHTLVGGALFPVRRTGWGYPLKAAVEAPEEALTELLRERTSLGALPREKVLALLRGEGDVEEAERVWTLARLKRL